MKKYNIIMINHQNKNMTYFRLLTTEEIDNIIALAPVSAKGYLKRFKDEIEVQVLDFALVVKLPLNPQGIYELKIANELENVIKEVFKGKEIRTYLTMSKNYFSVQEYQKFTKTTAIYPRHHAMEYLGMGLASEAGEVAGVLKKWIRGDYSTKEMQEKLKKELGDVLWYVARLADEQNFLLSNIFELNKAKLQQRKETGAINGDGDDR